MNFKNDEWYAALALKTKRRSLVCFSWVLITFRIHTVYSNSVAPYSDLAQQQEVLLSNPAKCQAKLSMSGGI